mgnify:CR=1 FL=1
MENNLKVAVIGSNGFVGSSLCRLLSKKSNVELYAINRSNFYEFIDIEFDVLIEAACNSKKYLAEENPAKEAELSILHRIRSLTEFKAKFHIHLSSVDVYDNLADPVRTQEDANIDISKCSHYGAHKLVSEVLVKHYAPNWLIFRLSGMVGDGLRKNPIYDIMHGRPIFIHPNSRYQFCNTDFVAKAIWDIFKLGISDDIFNIAGKGTISPEEIYQLYGHETGTKVQYEGSDVPRVVEINTTKLESLLSLQETVKVVTQFITKK